MFWRKVLIALTLLGTGEGDPFSEMSSSTISAGEENSALGEQKQAALPAGWADRLLERKRYDFGRIPAGARAEIDFPLTNIYPFEVEISRIRETCECTHTILSKEVLAPGEQILLTARLRTDRFQGRKGATITITLVRPEFAEVQLHVTAYIDPAVSLEPGEIDCGSLQPGQRVQREAILRSMSRADWRIEAVQPSANWISANISEIERTDRQVQYRLRIQAEAQGVLGPFKELVILKSNDPQSPEIPVLVTGRIAAEVEVHPPVLWLGPVEPGGRASKALVVRAQRPFTILAADSDIPGLAVQRQEADRPKPIHVLTVRYEAGESAGKVVGAVRIQMDLVSQPLIVPVQVRIVPTAPEKKP